MLAKITELLKSIFKTPSLHDELDAFITRQQPTSVGDVEHWINVFDRRQARGNLWIHTR